MNFIMGEKPDHKEDDGEGLGHGKLVSSQGEGGVEQNSALTTDVLLVVAGSSLAGSPVHWSGVSSALSSSVTSQTNVTFLSPAVSPAVPHDPVVSLVPSAVPH